MEKIEFTREEIYEMVWSEPLSKLARKYSISDNGLRKICKKHNIPLPTNGHWQRVKWGYKTDKKSLPKVSKDPGKIVLCFRDKDGKYIEHVETPITKHKKELKKNEELPVKVPTEITTLDPMIRHAQKSLLSGKHYQYDCHEIFYTANGEISITVSEPNIERALLFMDTLIKLLRKRKHDVQIIENTTYAIVDGEKFHIYLKERRGMTRGPSKYGSYSIVSYFAKGDLIFGHEIRSWRKKEWSDGKYHKIEDKLLEMLSYFEITAKEMKEERIEDEKRRIRQQEEERIRKMIEEQKNEEIKKFKRLINQANYWKQAMVIREYLGALDHYPDLSDERKEWLNWAKIKIEWFDPFTQVKDDILNDYDRNKLIRELLEANQPNQLYGWR